MDWLRLYNRILDDPKVQRLEPELFKAWINLLCLASEQDERGSLPDSGDIAFRLRVPESTMSDWLLTLTERGLIDVLGEAMTIHNWPKYQYPSDNSTGRVRKYREHKKQAIETVVTGGETNGNVSVTPQIRVDTDTEQTSSIELETREQKPKRKVQIPEDWEPTDSGKSFAAERGVSDVATETQKFRDNHRSKGSTFLDIDAAWRTWCSRHKEFARATSANGHGNPKFIEARDNIVSEEEWAATGGGGWKEAAEQSARDREKRLAESKLTGVDHAAH